MSDNLWSLHILIAEIFFRAKRRSPGHVTHSESNLLFRFSRNRSPARGCVDTSTTNVHDEFFNTRRDRRSRLRVVRPLWLRRCSVRILTDKVVNKYSARYLISCDEKRRAISIAEGDTQDLYLIVKDTIESTTREVDFGILDTCMKAATWKFRFFMYTLPLNYRSMLSP